MATADDPSDVADVLARLRARVPLPRPIAMSQVSAPRAWLPHLDRLDRSIAEIDPEYQLAQVKQKLGGLCFYLQAAGRTEQDRARIAELVREAEHASYTWT